MKWQYFAVKRSEVTEYFAVKRSEKLQILNIILAMYFYEQETIMIGLGHLVLI